MLRAAPTERAQVVWLEHLALLLMQNPVRPGARRVSFQTEQAGRVLLAQVARFVLVV